MLFLDSWAGDSLASLAGPTAAEQQQAAISILDAGLDLLTARGARVLWAYAGNYDHPLQLAASPLNRAMTTLKARGGATSST